MIEETSHSKHNSLKDLFQSLNMSKSFNTKLIKDFFHDSFSTKETNFFREIKAAVAEVKGFIPSKKKPTSSVECPVEDDELFEPQALPSKTLKEITAKLADKSASDNVCNDDGDGDDDIEVSKLKYIAISFHSIFV